MLKGRTHTTLLNVAVSAFCAALLFGCAPTLEERFAAQTDAELFQQGKALYDQEEYQEALAYFLYLKEHFIRSQYAGPARFYAGNCYFAEEEYEDAASEYESFLLFFSDDPLSAEARFKLGVSYVEQSKGPERDQTMLHAAFEAFQTLQDDLPADNPYAQQASERIQATRQELARHEFSVGRFYRKDRKFAASNRRLRYLIEEYPESELVPDAWYMQGLNFRDTEQFEEAAAAFSRVIEMVPDSPLAEQARQAIDAPDLSDARPPTLPDTAAASSDARHDSGISGSILTVRDTTVTTDLINADGITEGMHLDVYRADSRIGRIRIATIHEGFSTAIIVSQTPEQPIQPDDRVCCPEEDSK